MNPTESPQAPFPPPPPPPPPPKIEAVLFPAAFPARGSLHERVIAVSDVAAQHLGGNPYIRDVGGGRKLATLGLHDTLLYPTGHPQEGYHRYEWREGPDGLLFGVLRPES